jgi:long-subunit acyl-CoA synthetase (AMP-forming)
MAQALKRTVATHGDRVALRTIDDAVNLTWAQLHARAEAVGRGLHAIGLDRGHSMAMMLTNRPEFNICDLGAMLLGATPFSIYNTCAPEQIEFIFSDSGAHILVTEQALLANVLTAREKLRSLRHIVVVDGEPPPGACSLAEIETAGAISTFDISSASAAIAPEDVLTLIYTSGTTGDPKGVEITHENIRGVALAAEGRVGWPDDARVISWLPAAHIAERAAHHYLPIIHGATVTTCPDSRKIAEFLAAVQPTWFFAVPRIWEKMKAAIELELSCGAGGMRPSPSHSTKSGWRRATTPYPPPWPEPSQKPTQLSSRPLGAGTGWVR